MCVASFYNDGDIEFAGMHASQYIEGTSEVSTLENNLYNLATNSRVLMFSHIF
jgi:hypothetical protein